MILNNSHVFSKLKLMHQVVAVVTLLLGVACLLAFPWEADLAEGYITPIIALEFAHQLNDLAFLTASDELAQKHRNEIDNGHLVDMLFLVSYSLLLCFSVCVASTKSSTRLSIGLAFSILIIPFDIYENLVLLDITKYYDQPALLKQLLSSLQLWTTLKWSCIGASLIAIGAIYIVDSNKVFFGGILATSGGGVLLGTLVLNHPIVHELMSSAVALSFLMLILNPLIKNE